MSAKVFLIYSLSLVILFFGTVNISIAVKESSGEIDKKYQEIESLRIDNRRLRIEQSLLTNPLDTLQYVEDNGLHAPPLANVRNIEVIK